MKNSDYCMALVRKMMDGDFSVLYAIKAFPGLDAMEPRPDAGLTLADKVFDAVKEMTPREFMQIFPIEKRYDGEKWGEKDYFSVMEDVKRHGLDKKITEPERFLMDYMNDDVGDFIVRFMGLASDAYKRATGRSMLLDGMEACGMEYTAYIGDDLSWVCHFDGKDTRVVMPNFGRRLLDE